MSISDRLLDRLSRRTTSGRFIPEIDGLRFVSIAFVVLFHVCGYVAEKSGLHYPALARASRLGAVGSVGHFGVQLFFIISGFVLMLPFAMHYLTSAKPVPLRAYLLRRLTRLEPPYIIAMTGFTVALVVLHRLAPADAAARHGASLLYVHNLVYGIPSVVNVVAWSLEIEVQFYLLAPLLARVFMIAGRRRRRAVILGAVIALTQFQAAFILPGTRLALTLIFYLQFFLIGFLLADLYVADWEQKPETTLWWDLVTLVGWPVLVAHWLRTPVQDWLFPLLALLLFVAAFRGTITKRVISNRWLATIGGMCYSIYLLHYPLISFIAAHTLHIGAAFGLTARLLVQLALLTPVILLVSAIYFALVERPCMDREWPRKLAARLRRLFGRKAVVFD